MEPSKPDISPHPVSLFSRIAQWSAETAGSGTAFVLAAASIVVWAATGPVFHYSEEWQIVINTGTTIITFLMIFLIQNSQNRESAAVQIKLDELIRAVEGAHNAMLDLEKLDMKQLEAIRQRYGAIADAARRRLEHGQNDTGSGEGS